MNIYKIFIATLLLSIPKNEYAMIDNGIFENFDNPETKYMTNIALRAHEHILQKMLEAKNTKIEKILAKQTPAQKITYQKFMAAWQDYFKTNTIIVTGKTIQARRINRESVYVPFIDDFFKKLTPK